MQSPNIIPIYRIKDTNGETDHDRNMRIQHSIPIGSLVEVRGTEDWPEWHGVRMYVTKHSRDCDGSPLYSIGLKNADGERPIEHSGFGQYVLTVVSPPTFGNY